MIPLLNPGMKYRIKYPKILLLLLTGVVLVFKGISPAFCLASPPATAESFSEQTAIIAPSPIGQADLSRHRQSGADFGEALKAFHSSRYQQARNLLHQAGEDRTCSSRAHQLRGWTYWLMGDEERTFDELLQSLKKNGWGREIVIPEIVKLNLNRKQKQTLISLLKSLAETTTQPTIRSLSQLHTGCLHLERGECERARQQFEQLSFWPVWHLIGPFDNQQNSGFDEVYPPEETIDLQARYEGKRGEVSWVKVRNFDPAGYVDLGALLRPHWGAAAYLLAYVYSPRSQPAAFRLSTDGRFKLWLNDNLLLVQDKEHGFQLDQDVVGAYLNPGWNKILLKSCLSIGRWRIGLRLNATDGSPLNHLEASFLPQPYQPTPVRRVEVDAGLKSYLEGLQKRRELSPLELFWQAQRASQNDYREEAISHFEKLLSLEPACSYYRLCLGKCYLQDHKPTQALREFKLVLKDDSSSLRAHYELGQYYVQKKFWEKALTHIQTAVNLNPRFLPGQIYLNLIFFHKNWLEDAYQGAQATVQAHPDSAWAHNNLGVYAEAKELGEKAQAEYRKASLLNHTYRDPRERLCQLYQQQGNFKQAIREYREIMGFEPLEEQAYLKLAHYHQVMEQYQQALRYCQKLLGFCPHHHGARVRQGHIYYAMGEKERAIQSWKIALKQKPDDIWLREFLAHLSPEQNPVFARFEFSETAVGELIASAPSAADYPKAAALILLDQAIDQVFDDGSSTQSVHQVVKILNQKGIGQYSQISIPATDTLKLQKAVTISPSGEEEEATEIDRGVVSLPALEPGSIVEWKYTVERRQGGWLDRHYYQTFYFQDENPILKSQYVLALPKERDFWVYRRGEGITQRQERAGDNVVHIWESDNNAQIYDEYDRPPLRDLVALVSVSTIPSWDDLARWQNSLIKDQFELDSAAKEKLSSLIWGLETPADKIRAVYDFIVSEIRYLNLSQGIFGKKPHRAVNIFAHKYGDCKDKATLMIALLQELGIKAYYAGIRVRSTGRIFMDVSYPQTNHILVYIPQQAGVEEDIFLDGTAEYLSFSHLPADDQGVEAIILRGADHCYLTTPVSPPEKNQKQIWSRVRLQPDGAIEVEEELRLNGIYSQQYRQALRVNGRREEILEKLINRTAPGAVISSAHFTGLEELTEETSICSRYQAPHFARLSPGKIIFSPLHRSLLSSHFTRKAQRIYDLEIDFTRRVTIEECYQLPSGLKVVALPPDFERESEYAAFRITYQREGSELVCRREFRLKVLTVPQKDYAQFRDFCLACDQAEERLTLLELEADRENGKSNQAGCG